MTALAKLEITDYYMFKINVDVCEGYKSFEQHTNISDDFRTDNVRNGIFSFAPAITD